MDISAAYAALTPHQINIIDAFTEWKSLSSYNRLRREFTTYKGYKRSYVSWKYDSPSGTASVIESLSRKGFFEVTESPTVRAVDGIEKTYRLSSAAIEFFLAKQETIRAERAERDRVSQERGRREWAKAKAANEAVRALTEKYNDEFIALRDELEAKYLAD